MLERLLELLLHAKSGVFASVLVLGTTGALVTASVATAGNVTTITLTQASASPSAETLTSPTASPKAKSTHSAEASPTASLSSSPLNAATTTTTTCTPDQNANTAVKTVDTAFSTYHTDLMHLRTENKGDAGKTLLANADKLLKQLRQEAVKAIHASSTCKTDMKDDEDKQDGDTDTEEADKANHNVEEKDEKDTEDESDDDKAATSSTTTLAPTATPTPSTTVVTTGNATTIADNAVAAMKLVFDTAKADFAKLPASTAKSHDQSDNKKSDKDKKGQSGEHKDND